MRSSFAVGSTPVLTLLAFLWAAPAAAQSLPTPVEVTLEGIFGPDVLLEGGYAGILITLHNRTGESFSGNVEVRVSDWGNTPDRHSIAVDLPASEDRRVQLTVFVPSSGASIDATYRTDGGNLLGLASQSVAYAGGAQGILVIADQPAHLRAGLLDLQVEEPITGSPSYPSATGGTRTVAIPIGGSQLDARTGDPLLPTDPHAYSNLRMVIASLPTLSHAGEDELRALEDYVIAGGSLVLAPRTPADLSLPMVTRHFGEVTPSSLWMTGLLAPPETRLMNCPSADLTDGIGCARRVGMGVVRLVPMDLSAGSSGTATWPRSLVLLLLRERDNRGTPALPFALGLDPTETGYWDGTPTFGWLRRALDPNEGYRTSLALVAIILFLYVIFVGPIHFKLIERRKQPTLALVTTPILALLCAATLFTVGYLGKGILMRYRRLAFVEVAAGSDRGTSRSYTGLFFTRPAAATLTSAEGAMVRRIASPAGGSGPLYVHQGGRVDADGIRGGLWDTAFLREDRVLGIGGAIHFETEGSRYAYVVNDSDLDLRSAVFVDNVGSAFVVGDVPAHGRAPIATSTGWYFYEAAGGWWGDGGDATTTTLQVVLRLNEGEAPMARGLQSVLGRGLVDPHDSALYAWVDEGSAPDTDPGFDRDWDRRIVRVVARAPLSAAAAAAPTPATFTGAAGGGAQ